MNVRSFIKYIENIFRTGLNAIQCTIKELDEKT